MRKLKLQVQMSVDGFIAGPNGEMDWMTYQWDDELNGYVSDITEPVDCIVLGRKLAEGFIPYWASEPQGVDAQSVEKFNSTKKVVFTRTLETSEWQNTTLATGDLTEEITRLKKEPGGDLIAYGGSAFVASLIKHGLIDEYHLFINPVALGQGLAIFQELDTRQKFVLRDSKPFACGIVALRYDKAAGDGLG